VSEHVEDRDHGWDRIKAEARKAAGSFVSAGIHATDSAPNNGTTTAMVGAFHEFGLGVPERPWLSTAIDDNRDEIEDMTDRLYDGILAGRVTTERSLRLIGQNLEDRIKGKINEGDGAWPALSDATIERKGSAKPLVDTGQMVQSIRYRVHMGGEG